VTNEFSDRGPDREGTGSDLPLVVRVEETDGVISLSGDLTGTNDVRLKLSQALEPAARRTEWRVEAGDARVVPEGVEAWLEATRAYLQTCVLSYGPSQLAMILQFDSTYQHPRSSFAEEPHSQKEIMNADRQSVVVSLRTELSLSPNVSRAHRRYARVQLMLEAHARLEDWLRQIDPEAQVLPEPSTLATPMLVVSASAECIRRLIAASKDLEFVECVEPRYKFRGGDSE
jgi:hypothetical protein